MEKEEIKDEDKKIILSLLSHFESNCYILGKVLVDRTLLEADLKYIEKRTSTTDSTLKKFDANAEKIHQLKDRKAKLIKELEALNEEL